MSSEDLALDWVVRGPGSARLTWVVEGETIEVPTSYVGDGLRSLLQAAIDLQRGSSSAIASLSDEPGGHVLFFGGAAEDVYVQIVCFPYFETGGDPWRNGARRWAGQVSVSAFVRAVVGMAQAVLAEHGEAGYARLWGGTPFPEAELGMLQKDA